MNPSLYDAATIGDLDFLQKIQDGLLPEIDLRQKTPRHNNVLHLAAEFKQTNFFRRVKDSPQSPRFWATNKSDETPLHVAARAGCLEIIEFIIQCTRSKPIEGVDPGPIDNESVILKRTMSDPARAGCHEIIEFIIQRTRSEPIRGVDPGPIENESVIIERTSSEPTEGVDPENGQIHNESVKKLLKMTNLEKDTALHVAVRYGHDRVVALLMTADPQLCGLTNNANESPLFLAVRKGSPDIARYILDKSPTDIPPSFEGTHDVTALHAAVTRPHFTRRGIVKMMVSKNPEKIKATDKIGWTPLHYAALRGNLKATQLLIQPDPSSVCYILDKLGMSALHIAAYAGHTQILEELIKCRPDICDLVNLKGQTALHAAVAGEKVNAVKYILNTPKLARLLNQADNNGNSPLHLAAIYQNRKILLLLSKDHRMDTTAINNKFQKARDILHEDKIVQQGAVDYRRKVMIAYLGLAAGVPMLQEQITHEFEKLDPPDQRNLSAGPPAITQLDGTFKRHDTKLLVATLIATVTFTAALNVPGGFHTDGRPALSEIGYFKVFWAFNQVAFLLSILAIYNESTPIVVLSVYVPTPSSLIRYSIAAMVIAFIAGELAVAHKRQTESLTAYLFGGTPLDIVLGVITLIFFCVSVYIPIATSILRLARKKWIHELRNHII